MTAPDATGSPHEQLAGDVIRLSHDLRTPLTAIRGFADVMIKRGDELSASERHEFLTRISTNAAALDGLIAELSRAAQDTVGGATATDQPPSGYCEIKTSAETGRP